MKRATKSKCVRTPISAAIMFALLATGCERAAGPALPASGAAPQAKVRAESVTPDKSVLAFKPDAVTVNGGDPANTVLSYKTHHPPQLSSDCGTSSNPLAEITQYKTKKVKKVTYAYEHVYGLNEYSNEKYQCTYKAFTGPPHPHTAKLKITVIGP